MSDSALSSAFDGLSFYEKMILAMLAIAGEPMGRGRLHEHLAAAAIRDDDDLLSHDLAKMQAQGLVGSKSGRGWVMPEALTWPAIKAALDQDKFFALATAYQELTPMRKNWEGYPILRSYRQGIALLRICLIGGVDPAGLVPILSACMSCHEAGYLHPWWTSARAPSSRSCSRAFTP